MITWPLTILAGFTGLMFNSVLLALLGLLVGSILDASFAFHTWAQVRRRLRFKRAKLFSPRQTLFMLLGHVAKSTGRVTTAHIQLARAEMQCAQLFGRAQTAAIEAFNQGKDCQLADLRRSLRTHYREPDKLERLLLAGWRMALVQGLATTEQRIILQQCADWLGCSRVMFMRLKSQARPVHSRQSNAVEQQIEAALQLLAVKHTDTLVQIKTAYRRQLSIHHPDKLIGAGATPAQVEVATEKTRALHNAYAVLHKHL